MNKNDWALITSVDTEVEREKLGYQILQDDTIKCADCGKKLINIIKVKEDDSIVKDITVKCYCGGSSFKYRIAGHTYMQAVQGVTITNMPTNIDGETNIMKITIETMKNE